MTFHKSGAPYWAIAAMGLAFYLSSVTVCSAQDKDVDQPQSQRIFQADTSDNTRVIGIPNLGNLKLDLGFEQVAFPPNNGGGKMTVDGQECPSH